MFRRKTGDLDGLAVGGEAVRNVLVHPLGLADTRPGRKRRARTVDPVRLALGNRSPGQYFPAGVPACLRTMGVVPALAARQVFTDWSRAVRAGIFSLHRAMAGTEPPDFGSDVSALELRRRVAHREWPWRRWNVEGISPSYAKCLPDAPLPPTRRDRLCCGAQARGGGFHSRGLRALPGPLYEALH